MAALAAGVASSMAQSNVYSLNIVGYANVPNRGYSFQSNPFDASPDNSAVNVIPNPAPDQNYSGPMDQAALQVWTGVGFTVYNFDSVTTDTTTGFVTPAGNPVVGPVLSSGQGYLLNNFGPSNNVTYVGTVRTGTNAISFPARLTPYAVGSPLPLAGGVSSALGFVNSNPAQLDYDGVLDNSKVEFLKTTLSGAAAGYSVALFDSITTDTTTGFTTPAGAPIPEPQISVGQGFFFVSGGTRTNLSAAYVWTQILNP
jgi:hypothetical protein